MPVDCPQAEFVCFILVYIICTEDKSAYKWFCEQYDGNEIAQGLIGQLSQANRYLPDRWSVTYGQQVHK